MHIRLLCAIKRYLFIYLLTYLLANVMFEDVGKLQQVMFILIGRRCDNLCASINLSTGHNIHWVSEMRCLATGLHCPVCDYEEGLYRSANNIFLGKIGGIGAFEEVIWRIGGLYCMIDM